MQGTGAQRKNVILIIEDEDVMRKVLSDNLIAEGFEVLEARDGSEGLKTALERLPDLILLDNRMPGMGGFEMLKRLREMPQWGENVPVIFVSNIEPASREERADIESVGASYYLLKVHTSIDHLVEKIREILKEG